MTEDTSWFPGGRGRRLFERVLDYLAERPGAVPLSYVGISMLMILASPRRLLDRVKAAGVDMFYLVGGFDPISRRAVRPYDPRARQRALDAIARPRMPGSSPTPPS